MSALSCEILDISKGFKTIGCILAVLYFKSYFRKISKPPNQNQMLQLFFPQTKTLHEYNELLIINNFVIWFIFKVPENMSAPALQSLTPTSVLVDWSAPEKPNGLIANYQIERRVNGTSNITMVTKVLPEAKRQYVDDMSELSPFTVYDYRVIVVNGAGSLSSQWSTIITKSSSRSPAPYFSVSQNFLHVKSSL